MSFEFKLYCLSNLVKDMKRYNQDIDEYYFSFNKIRFNAIFALPRLLPGIFTVANVFLLHQNKWLLPSLIFQWFQARLEYKF